MNGLQLTGLFISFNRKITTIFSLSNYFFNTETKTYYPN